MSKIEKKGISIQQAAEIRKQKSLTPTKLEMIRVSQNMSQNDLAKKASIKLRSIQCCEQRTRAIDGAKLNTLLNFCVALNCKITDILEEEETIQKFNSVLEKEADIIYTTENIETEEAVTKSIDENEYLFLKFFNNELIESITDDQRNGINFLINDFSQDWKRILELRYIDKLSLAKIGKQVGVTAERVRQILIKSIKKLKEYDESEYVILGLKATQEKEIKETEERLFFDRPIEELGLSGRAYNCLMRAGFNTVGSVVLSRKDLINIKKIGSHVVDEINEKIDVYTKEFLNKG